MENMTQALMPQVDKSSPSEENFFMKSRKIFLYKLFTLLEENEHSDIISWTLSGDKFIIKDPVLCAQEVLPRVFNHNKYSSFTRQLSFYRFKRISDKNGNRIYYHQYFMKGKQDLLEMIDRVKHKRSAKAFEQEEKETTKRDFEAEQLKLLSRIAALTEQLEESREIIRTVELENERLKSYIKQLTKRESRLIDSFDMPHVPQIPRYLNRERFSATHQTFLTHHWPPIFTAEGREPPKFITIQTIPKINREQEIKNEFEFNNQNLNHSYLLPQRPRFLMNFNRSSKDNYEKGHNSLSKKSSVIQASKSKMDAKETYLKGCLQLNSNLENNEYYEENDDHESSYSRSFDDF